MFLEKGVLLRLFCAGPTKSWRRAFLDEPCMMMMMMVVLKCIILLSALINSEFINLEKLF